MNRTNRRYTGIATIAGLCLITGAVWAQNPLRGNRLQQQSGQQPTLTGKQQGKGGKQHKHGLAWSLTDGKPDIQVGKQVGYFIWHDASFVYVATTDESDKGQKFTGMVGVKDGTISNVSGLKDEKDDRFQLVRPDHLRFHFKTHEGLDGVKFQISQGAKSAMFNLRLQGKATSHIFLGKNMVEPEGPGEHGRLLFDLSK